MAVFEIKNKPEFGPYSATIGSSDSFEGGQIRVEPPFVPGEWLKIYFHGDMIDLEYAASDANGTVLSYSLDSDANFGDFFTRAKNMGEDLLRMLGQVHNRQMFIDNYVEQQ
jgi:hypothetical protein